MSASSELPPILEWVRRRDGRQVPFDADRICQSLFAATEAIDKPNAFLARELTDAIVHFLTQEFAEAVPTTEEIAECVEKTVRELGQPLLARRFADRQTKSSRKESPPAIAIQPTDSPEAFVKQCLQAYSLNVLFSSDLRSAVREGLLHLSGLTTPATLTGFVADALALGEESWWFSWEGWKACAGHWLIDSPEWLSVVLADRLPIVRLRERIVSLFRAANHGVELHLNTAEPPAWIHSLGSGPLFGGAENPLRVSHRFGFLDMLLEGCLSLPAEHAPTIAWHLHDEAFRDPAQLGRLKMLVRHALQGKAVCFVFDRPSTRMALSQGMDRQSPGLLLEIGLDLAVFAQRPDIAGEGLTLLKKLPTLARMAVSAAGQKRQYLRKLPEDAPLKRGFLIERAVCNVVPLALDDVVQNVTGQSMAKSSLSLHFGLRILRTLQQTLQQAGRAANLEMRLETVGVGTRAQLSTTSQLHSGADSGTATLLLSSDADMKADFLAELLRSIWAETAIVRLKLQSAEHVELQRELGI